MIVKREKLYFKNGYELKPLTENEAITLSLNEQVYVKKNGVAYPMKITGCYENAPKFKVEPIK